MKKAISLILIGLMMLSLAACGGGNGSGGGSSSGGQTKAATEVPGDPKSDVDISGSTIEVTYNFPNTSDDFFAMVQAWGEANGVTIQETMYGLDHEEQMKTRMGSNDMPDIWETHGWSIIRYGEYTMDLSDQPWVADIQDGMKDVVTTDDGQLYILPVGQGLASVVYNKDVLDAAGVDPTAIRTWDDFNTALAAVKEKTDAAPIGMSLEDGSAFDAFMLELTLPSFYTNADIPDNKAAAFMDGTFDFTKDASEAFDLITGWYNNGYFNEDYVSCKRDDVFQYMGNGDVAFTFYENSIYPSAQIYNPEANIGMLPIPASSDDTASYFAIGEGNYSCFAISKDTEYPEACKELLKYFAQPEVAAKICEWGGDLPALTTFTMPDTATAAATAASYAEAQQQFEGDLIYDNVFDRQYLPSGMWNIMQQSVKELITDGDPEGHRDSAMQILQDGFVNNYAPQ